MEIQQKENDVSLCDNHELVKVYTFIPCLVAKISWHAESTAGKSVFSPIICTTIKDSHLTMCG
jgi:hypothetical protein